jgi:hypothetical protein
MGIATASKNNSGKGGQHIDTQFQGSDFNPHVTVNQNTFVWASVTEIDPQGDPISGGAHVTVQQVTPANNGIVFVRTWVDNVPNPIRFELSVFALT